jgi:hypothetical protein
MAARNGPLTLRGEKKQTEITDGDEVTREWRD